MNDQQTGWLFVAVQILLLGGVLFLPGSDDWNNSGALELISWFLRVAGLIILVAGVFGLGASLTPTPVPVDTGELKTGGLYGLMRHPIYTGVILIVAASAITSGSFVRAFIAILTVVFFNIKARWEEVRLTRRYPEYPAYASVVPRFIPRP